MEGDDMTSVESSMVEVDRQKAPNYPARVKRVLRHKLEQNGPRSFDAGRIVRWRHPNQQIPKVLGVHLYNMPALQRLLPDCLGLQDLEAVQARKLSFYRRYFPDGESFPDGERLYAWKSAAEFYGGEIHVPYLTDPALGSSVTIDISQLEPLLIWGWIGGGFPRRDAFHQYPIGS